MHTNYPTSQRLPACSNEKTPAVHVRLRVLLNKLMHAVVWMLWATRLLDISTFFCIFLFGEISLEPTVYYAYQWIRAPNVKILLDCLAQWLEKLVEDKEFQTCCLSSTCGDMLCICVLYGMKCMLERFTVSRWHFTHVCTLSSSLFL